MKKSIKIILIVSIVVLVIFSCVFFPIYFLFLHHYHGKKIENPFSANDVFELSTIRTIEKQKDKPFTILNLADVQMCDLEDIPHMDIIHKEITQLVNEIKPDLITLTGDQTWSNENLISLTQLIGWMESYEIPWAPVFGNHDFGNEGHEPVLDALKCCEYYENAKYCLFDRGPSNLGCVGNYIINIKEEDKIYRTLYFLDYGVLNAFTQEQIDWLNWSIQGIKENNHSFCPEGMMFFHKPTSHFYNAYSEIENSISQSANKTTFAQLYETAVESNIKNFVCGHNHWLHFSQMDNNGITFTMALKTGELSGYYEDEAIYGNGATYFTLEGTKTTVSNTYVSKETYHIDKN